MTPFTDSQNRSWGISLTIGSAKRVRDVLDVDLLQPEFGDPPLLTRLGTDRMLMAEVISCLLTDEYEAKGVDEADILAAFDGPTILAAQTAFYSEYADFFLSSGRTDLAKAVAKQTAMIEAGIEAVAERIDGMDVDEVISGVMSGGSPDRSVSTPAT